MSLTKEQLVDIGVQAARINVPANCLAAVVDVESAGVVSAGLPNRLTPVIRIEGHYFDKRLTGAARTEARELGLSSPKAGAVKNGSQASRYDQLQKMINLCKKYGVSIGMAYESCSWGVGQVMGANWRELGFKSAEDFVATVCNGFAGQVQVMADFIRVNNLDDELRDGRFASFARGYNGPGYKANRYDTKIKAAADRYGATIKGADGFLRMGAKGARVRELQALLVTAGFAVKVDGDFGPATKASLKAYQKLQGIAADGIYGPETEGRLSTLRTDPNVVPGEQRIAAIPKVQRAVAAGGGATVILAGAKEVLSTTIDQIAPFAMDNAFFTYVQGGLTLAAAAAALAGIGYAAYGYLKAQKTVEV